MTVKNYLELKTVALPDEPNVEAVINNDTLVDVISTDEVLRGNYEQAVLFLGAIDEIPEEMFELKVNNFDFDNGTLMLYV